MAFKIFKSYSGSALIELLSEFLEWRVGAMPEVENVISKLKFKTAVVPFLAPTVIFTPLFVTSMAAFSRIFYTEKVIILLEKTAELCATSVV